MIRLWTLGSLSLTDARGAPVDTVAAQSKRMAILVYLALALPRGWHRRDTILALFWPELDQTRGRHALRQALHFLRRHLGDGIVRTRGSEDLAAGPDLWCDAAAFEDAEACGEALALYRGALLDGFFVRDAAPEFDRWLEQRRATLRALALSTCEGLARARRTAGDLADALVWARRASGIAPLDEGVACRVAELLGATGRAEEGVRELEGFRTRLEEDLELPLSPATSDLMTRLRQAPPAAAVATPPSPTPLRSRRLGLGALALIATVAAAFLGPWIAPQRALARSALADSLYTRGLTTLEDHIDSRAALGWFEAALQASPRFALAAYYAGVSADGVDAASGDQWFARAAALAPHASEHDRLVIETALAFRRDDPAAVTIAESLASRYASDPLAHHALGSALLWSGDFSGALREFRSEQDLTGPKSGEDGPPGCQSCGALDGIAMSLQFLDSLAAAERVAREGVSRAPHSAAAWNTLAIIEAAAGHFPDARAAGRRVADAVPGQPVDPIGAADLAIRAGNFRAADQALRDALSYGASSGRREALWLLVISLRNQGRLREALAAARAYRVASLDSTGLDAIPVAQVLFEEGRAREAAVLFDSIAAPPAPGRAGAFGVEARHQAWTLTHAAEAWAAAGDTTRVRAYADTIRRLAARSLYGRDRHLAEHLDGLVWAARGNPDSAFGRFGAAVFSLTIGYTRTNLALGRALLARGRAREAAAVASAGLAEAVDGSAYYATRTELHELAAQAFDAAGQRDSAVAHYAGVVRAWARADPSFGSRVKRARIRLTFLREHRGID